MDNLIKMDWHKLLGLIKAGKDLSIAYRMAEELMQKHEHACDVIEDQKEEITRLEAEV